MYRIDYFELAVADGEASRAFFGQAFGWTFKSYGPTYTEITDAGVLGGITSSADDHGTPLQIGIRTDDIVAAERAVRDAGGIVTRGPYDFPGGKRFHFREPGGNEMLVYMEA